MLQIKTRKHTVHRFISRKYNMEVEQYFKILPELVIFLVNFPKWLVGLLFLI